MTITTASAKAKGRRFQQEVIRLLARIVGLDLADMESRPGGQNGEDIILGMSSRARFPYSIECKNRKSYKGLYVAYDQAVANAPKWAETLLYLRTDRRKPLAIVGLSHFFELFAGGGMERAGPGANGTCLFASSRDRYPYSVEYKHRKSYKELYAAYDQAVANAPKGAEPLLCLRTDRRKPLAVVDLDHFLNLVSKHNILHSERP